MNNPESIAIMQPYLFPYLGYFQLACASDTFVLYDNANYIKQGFINRNTILSANQPQRFTIPVNGASSFKRIKELTFSNDVRKFLKNIQQSYQKKPHFDSVYPVIEQIALADERQIASVCYRMLVSVFTYLGIDQNIILSSDIKYQQSGTASEKVISMCHALGSRVYINSAGGMALYDREEFTRFDLSLKFLQMDDVHYYQGNKPFVKNLSIIDVLMNCSPAKVKKLLTEYHLL